MLQNFVFVGLAVAGSLATSFIRASSTAFGGILFMCRIHTDAQRAASQPNRGRL